MTICRYFLEGRCRFGDRCYNEHISPGYSERPRYDSTNRSSRHSNWSNTRYPSPNVNSRNYAENSYNDYNPYQWRASQYDAQSRYDSPSQYDNRHAGGAYSPSRHEPRPSSFSPPRNRFDGNKAVPKEQEYRTDERTLANCIKEDLLMWEKGNQWPFSCYSPLKEIGCMPGFDDVSPEELRYEAYESLKNNTFSDYQKRIANVLATVKRKRELLMKQPETALSLLRNRQNLEENIMQYDNIGDTKNQARKVHFGKPVASPSSTNAFGKPESAFSLNHLSSSPSESSFSLNHLAAGKQETGFSFNQLLSNRQGASEIESMNEDSFPVETDKPVFAPTSTFRFTLPSQEVNSGFVANKSKPAEADDSPMYTPMEICTQDELDAFSAPTFTLGKIPINPPPRMFCS